MTIFERFLGQNLQQQKLSEILRNIICTNIYFVFGNTTVLIMSKTWNVVSICLEIKRQQIFSHLLICKLNFSAWRLPCYHLQGSEGVSQDFREIYWRHLKMFNLCRIHYPGSQICNLNHYQDTLEHCSNTDSTHNQWKKTFLPSKTLLGWGRFWRKTTTSHKFDFREAS